MRNEADHLLEAVAEAIEIGERAGLPVRDLTPQGERRGNWGKVNESLAMIEAARDRGVTVTLDQYPYTAGSTSLFAVLQNGALERTVPVASGAWARSRSPSRRRRAIPSGRAAT